jgi:hypothetical protein
MQITLKNNTSLKNALIKRDEFYKKYQQDSSFEAKYLSSKRIYNNLSELQKKILIFSLNK